MVVVHRTHCSFSSTSTVARSTLNKPFLDTRNLIFFADVERWKTNLRILITQQLMQEGDWDTIWQMRRRAAHFFLSFFTWCLMCSFLQKNLLFVRILWFFFLLLCNVECLSKCSMSLKLHEKSPAKARCATIKTFFIVFSRDHQISQ